MQHISQFGTGTEALRQVVLFSPKEEGLVHALRSQQPGSSTKLTSLSLFSCCSLLFAASVCHSASHPLRVLSLLGLYSIHCQAVSLMLCFNSSILSSAYLPAYLSVFSIIGRIGVRRLDNEMAMVHCTVTASVWDGTLRC